ncbi:MAG TPA: tRNA glutamyl-Q(34) synthetase GluQRS [Selenomonadales bacterium]|nr:tRNA glutamyl-Q(34) synthetase GluQRS [Selenomonadales bacterium]
MTAIRGRFAPSPTGEMHLGNAWTALLAWLEVRRLGGSMVLRIEDLDPDRSRPAFAAQLMTDLRWLGLDWDEGPDIGGPYGPYRQDDRRGLYQQAFASLARRGLVYPCYCTRAEISAAASAPHAGEGEGAYPGTCRRLGEDEQAARQALGRKPAQRLAVAAGEIEFQDGIHGRVRQDVSRSCGDFIIRRSDGVHAYQLAVVVDDAAMRISHILRGDDLLASTPRQILLYRLLGREVPAFSHVPLLCSPDGHRLSKRQKDLSLAALRGRGVSAEEVVGFLAWKARLLDTWQPIRPADLISRFSLAAIPRTPVVVDVGAFRDL